MACPRRTHPDDHHAVGPRPRPHGRRRDFAVAAAILVGLVAGCGGPAAEPAPSGPVLQDDGTYRVAVAMRDMAFVPDDVTVPAGSTLEIEVTNADGMPHDLVLDDGSATPLLSRGDSATLTVVVDDDVEGWCSVVGHREAGMVLDVRAG